MAKSLKDALLQAGLHGTKNANERQHVKGRPANKSEVHQRARTFCEVCERDLPDVERYQHPSFDKDWICIACADRNMIDDKFRRSHQSEMADKSMFKRFYGATRPAIDFKGQRGPDDKSGQKRR
tara:strand:- start:1809 stop:2180 length:372 start_codon:yes stop_codon:yes gene_type:complete